MHLYTFNVSCSKTNGFSCQLPVGWFEHRLIGKITKAIKTRKTDGYRIGFQSLALTLCACAVKATRIANRYMNSISVSCSYSLNVSSNLNERERRSYVGHKSFCAA